MAGYRIGDEVNFEKYLKALARIKSKYAILFAVRDVSGAFIAPNHAKLLQDIGLESDLSWGGVGKRHRTFIAFIDCGKIIYEELSANDDPSAYQVIYMGHHITLESKTWRKGNDASIVINGFNYAVNTRGLNIVIYDLETSICIDSVAFDTHTISLNARRDTWERDMAKTLNMIHALGYSLPQFLYDIGIKTLSIYINIHYGMLLNTILPTFRVNPNIKVNGYFAETDYLYSYYQAEEMGLRKFAKMKAPFSKEPVLNIDKTVSQDFGDAEILNLSDLVRQCYVFASYYRPILHYHHLNPKVSILIINMPHYPRTNLTENEKKRLSGAQFQQALKDGETFEFYVDKGYSNDEAVQMLTQPPSYLNEKGVKVYKDFSSKYVNCAEGIRVTVGQPPHYRNRIFIFGSCQEFGHTMSDAETLASHLQAYFNDVRVENCASYNWSIKETLLAKLFDIQASEGDVVIFSVPFMEDLEKYIINKCTNIYVLSLQKLFQRPHGFGEVYAYAGHRNGNGQGVVAEKVFNFIRDNQLLSDRQHQASKEESSISTLPIWGIPSWAPQPGGADKTLAKMELTEALADYKNSLLTHRIKIGTIVMNCNPFTLGHRYLIEYASSKVKHLYIFVVEEDRSIFPFADRIKLVTHGVADLANVTVLPSGQFIISQLTFSDYFNKSEMQDAVIDPSMDIELFARQIAPTLSITVRFAGEEPLDNITRQYNETMARILPKYGIEFVEIPRKENGGSVISASRVRALLENRAFDQIENLVPPTTLRYLIEDYKPNYVAN